MGFFEPPQLIEAEVFAPVPDKLRKRGAPSSWIDANHPGSRLDCFLEGPAFDRAGNLYMVDIPYGRILRMSPRGEFDVAAGYDGWPNGIAIHRDGRVFIADYRRGILTLDPKTGRVEDFLTHCFSESFKGVNDLTFARNGDLYFTDQGQTGIHDPTGRVYRYTTDGRLECLIDNGPSPNGLTLDPDDKVLYVAMTRANCMWHCPLKPGGGVSKAGVFAQLPGIHGPDGLAMDEAGNLSAAHARPGIIWLLSPIGEPLCRVQRKSKGSRMTNMAYGNADRRMLYITDSYNGAILAAKMPVAGKTLYSHL
ncbi:MAG: SMP-30/gluconolactonase/LRE family protein [Betaproteobacteria bacterium]|nr:SMP-30/gluconolactonase/LRE family protein [Betaproteobacteria bacterium]